jgi:hypothetical protein
VQSKNLKIKIMKKSVYYPGIACTILMLFGCMFKIMHWPGASIMLCLSVFLFCFYFLPVALLQGYKAQETPRYKNLYIITYIVFSICVMGVLFKVMHWPGAGMFLMVGLPLPFVLFLPAYLYSTRNEKKENSMNFLGLMFGLTFLAVFSVLLALSISKQVLRNAITRVYSIEKTSGLSETALTGIKAEGDVKKSADELCAYIEQIKCELLAATYNTLCVNNKMSTKDMWEMNEVDNKATPSFVLFNAEQEKSKFDILKDKIQNYQELLLASKTVDPELTELTKELFDVAASRELDDRGNVNELSWEQREFSNKQLIFVLGALSQIQSNVRIVTFEYLASLK